ncbi:MAG: tetratricopeptide repeat protein [Candidatus Saliniplasma sp.]
MGVLESLLETEKSCDFVNRWGELDELKEHMKETLKGNGRFVLLKGEAGVGKTRIAEKFSQDCSENDFRFMWGRCLYHESTDPYIPFIEALGDYIKRDESDSSTSTSEGYVGLGASAVSRSSTDKPISLVGLGSSTDKSLEISISNEREVMFTKVINLVKNLSEEQPLLLFLDDLQWIDEASSQLLHFLVRNIHDDRVMVMGAYRPEELKTHGKKKPLEVLLERTKHEGIVNILEINRMGFQPVSEIVKKQLQTSDLPESFLLTIYKETEGNPYYVLEILNSMVDEGVINPYSYNWNPQEDLIDISIPSSIKDITNRRIERLDDMEKKVLMYASVIGTEFNFEVLENAIDMDVLKLLDTCEDLENHDIISEKKDTDKEIYRFNHLQLRMTIYGNMGKTRKRILNKQIGDAIEEFYEDELEEHYYSLSRHFYEGKVYDKAYEYSIKAAEKALNAFAIETAIKYYENALASLRKSNDIEDSQKKMISILNSIGKLSYEISATERALEAFRSLLELSEKTGEENIQANALRWIGHTHSDSQDFESANESYQKALELYDEESKGYTDCKRGMGYLIWREGEFEEALELYQQVVKEAKELKDDHILSLTYIDMGNIYAQKGQNEKAIEYYERSIPALKKQNSYKDLERAYNNMGDQFMKMAEWEKAIEHFQKTMDYAKKIGDKRFIGWSYFNQAEALARKGDMEKAKKYTDRAEKVMKPIREKIGLSSVERIRAIIQRMQGDLEKALSSMERSWSYIEDLDIPFPKAENSYELGRIYLEKDEPEKAKENLEKAKRKFERLGAYQYLDKVRKHLETLKD